MQMVDSMIARRSKALIKFYIERAQRSTRMPQIPDIPQDPSP